MTAADEAATARLHAAISEYLRQDEGDPAAVLDDWFIAYSGRKHHPDAEDGIVYIDGYTTSDSAPHAVLGIAQLSMDRLEGDLLSDDEGEL